MKTIFTEITNDMYRVFAQYGFYYNSHSYINLYRWLWSEKNIRPNITNTDNKTCITFSDNTKIYITGGYDDVIINIVEFLNKNIHNYVNE